jgi:hypothetical protein
MGNRGHVGIKGLGLWVYTHIGGDHIIQASVNALNEHILEWRGNTNSKILGSIIYHLRAIAPKQDPYYTAEVTGFNLGNVYKNIIIDTEQDSVKVYIGFLKECEKPSWEGTIEEFLDYFNDKPNWIEEEQEKIYPTPEHARFVW